MLRLRQHGDQWVITLRGKIVARGAEIEMRRLYHMLGGLRMAEF